jgi:serine/threonine protein phosphatase PrpC
MSLITRNESKIFAKGVIGNVRKAQEDCHGYKLGTPNGDLFVVCDGMGGHVGGSTASRIAVESIISHIDQEQYATPVEALNGALQFANMQILGHADTHPELKGMGTTACIVLVREDDVWIAHVGDSRIYLYLGKEQQLHRITKDHSFVQTLVDAGEITDDEAEHHPNKNRILKALGIKPELQPTFNHENMPIHPKNGDVFLICSDGMSGMIPDSTIESVLDEEMSLHQKGERLIELAMIGETVQPGGQDNCTLELIEIDNSPWKKSEFMSYNPKRPAKSKTPKPQLVAPSLGNPQSVATQPKTKNSNRTLKILVGVVAVLLVGLVLAIVLLYTRGDNGVSEHNKLAKELNEVTENYLNPKIRTRNSKNSELKKTNDPKKKSEIEDKIKKLDKEIDGLRARHDTIAKKLRDIDSKYRIELKRNNSKAVSN